MVLLDWYEYSGGGGESTAPDSLVISNSSAGPGQLSASCVLDCSRSVFLLHNLRYPLWFHLCDSYYGRH